jgi:OOP family OmpA-OmpF porin
MSRRRLTTTSLLLFGALLLSGCAKLEWAPRGGLLWLHRELPAADRAIAAARSSGKATQCPDAFREAEQLRDEAYKVYLACRTQEGISLANQAVAKANALCPVAMQPAPPPPAPAPAPLAPAPPPPASPTVTLGANPASIQRGQCTTLSWSSTNSTSASISPGVGTVGVSGSQQVCPTSTTQYAIVASGAGGSANAATTVNVTAPPPPPPPPAPRVIDRLTLRINFDTDKAIIRNPDLPELQKAVDFIKKHPSTAKVSIEGHTDNRGSAAYNQKLSERRANAVKDYLLKQGVPNGSRMTTVGHGLSKPIADNRTAQGRFANRRTEILILSE